MTGRRSPISADRRLRVVVLVGRLSPSGGAERLARQIAVGLEPRRFERTLCVTRWRDADESDPVIQPLRAELDAAGVRFVGLRRESDRTGWWRPLFKLLVSEEIDVIHSHGFGPNLCATVLGRAAGVGAVVAHEHGWSFEGQPVRRALERNVIGRGASVLVAVSQADRRRMTAVEGIPPERTAFVPNGIPVPLPAAARDVRAELGIAPSAPVIGAVSLLRPEKGVDVLVRAAALLAPRHPGLKVLVAGRGGAREDLERLVDELGLGGTVVLLGRRTDVPDILAALDVAVSPSRREGTPLAVLEYMEAARPIVATAVGGVPDLIDDGVHGLLVRPQDPQALARAISALLDDRARAGELAANARARARREFDLSVTVDRVGALYHDLLGRRRRDATSVATVTAQEA